MSRSGHRRKTARRICRLALLLALAVGSLRAEDKAHARTRSSDWAQAVKAAGVPNLHCVNASLYRSAQPTAEGMRNLEKLGVKTIVNLRSFHSDRKELRGTELAYEHIYMKAWHPEEKELVRFLQIVTDPKRTPVLVHCMHGADRTGTLCAVYRMVVQGWSTEKALKEMREGGFNYHEVWKNLPAYVRKLDLTDLRKKAGLPPLPTPKSGSRP
ncbi:MAG: tyrosine-protein phosphatase [Lentisphaeria bacterium]|nr:tyrosine-protein phosphatase [Lentisphaeria bacterium]